MNTFTSYIKSLFATKKIRRIAFLDGDQPLPGVLSAYHKYVVGTGTDTHLIRYKRDDHKEPKILKNLDEVNKVYLTGYRTGKEIVDKFIAGSIQQAVSDGYQHITVISSDYDFIDIFKMAVQINPSASNVSFHIIVPHAQGMMVDTPAQIANIEIIKM